MKKIIIFFLCIFFCNCIAQKTKNVPDFNFIKLLKSSKMDAKIKTLGFKDADYFKGNINKCKSSFYKGFLKTRFYQLKNKKNNIIVAEYIFKDSTSSNNAFKIISDYANLIRTLKRINYSERCIDLWEDQIYYAISKGEHIYLMAWWICK